MKARLILIATLLLGFFLTEFSMTAAIPPMMTYQGHLQDTNGSVLNGNYTMTFRLFSQASSGSASWAETNSVSVTGGLFTALLGSMNPLPDAAFQGSTWLEVEINGTILSPRTQILSVGYALRSKISESVPNGTITSASLAPNSVTSSIIASNSITGKHITNAAISFVHLASNTVSQLVAQARAYDTTFSVRDFGAVGDGIADDTASFSNALVAANSGSSGRKVIVPPGRYRITSTLTLRDVLLTGLPAGAWPSDNAPLPQLAIATNFGTTPVIVAEIGASLHGLAFQMSQPNEAAVPVGPAISIAGNGVSLTNLRIDNAYDAIMSNSNVLSGRINLENIFIINPRRTGVYISRQYDVATVRNVHVWTYLNYCLNNTIAFKLGQSDELRLDHCSVVNCFRGFNFVSESYGSFWGGMTDCMTDSCQFGIWSDGLNLLRVNGGAHLCHWRCVTIQGSGNIVLTGATLQSNGDNNVFVNGGDSFTMTACYLNKSGLSWTNVPKVNLVSGKSALVTGCTFDDRSKGIVIQSSMNNFLINDNLFQPSPYPAITDNSASNVVKIVTNNLFQLTP